MLSANPFKRCKNATAAPPIDWGPITQDLMSSSRMDKKISILQLKYTQSRNIPSFESTASDLISKAFETNNPRSYYGRDPGGLSNGYFFMGCVRMYKDLPHWQRPHLHHALVEMELNEQDMDSLRVTLGLILRASGECQSRKQDVFTKVIDRSVNLDTSSGGLEESDPKTALYEASRVPIDELKETAFRSVFLEPTKMYFRAVGDHTMEGDVDVHGSNVYLAVLLETIGVKLPHAPLLEDEPKGIASFADVFYDDQLQELWKVGNKGKSWELVMGKDYYPYVSKKLQRNSFYAHGHNAGEVAKNIARKHSSEVKPYLKAFVAHFTAEQVAERLCKYFLYHNELHGHLNAAFVEVAQKNEVDEAGGDARCWLWDTMSGKFCLDRAVALLQSIGILK